jgi:hypothetical protein
MVGCVDVKDLSFRFSGATAFNQAMVGWVTSNVTKYEPHVS